MNKYICIVVISVIACLSIGYFIVKWRLDGAKSHTNGMFIEAFPEIEPNLKKLLVAAYQHDMWGLSPRYMHVKNDTRLIYSKLLKISHDQQPVIGVQMKSYETGKLYDLYLQTDQAFKDALQINFAPTPKMYTQQEFHDIFNKFISSTAATPKFDYHMKFDKEKERREWFYDEMKKMSLQTLTYECSVFSSLHSIQTIVSLTPKNNESKLGYGVIIDGDDDVIYFSIEVE